MVAKKKANKSTRGVKKLKLRRETLKDLDVSHGKRIKAGAGGTYSAVAACGMGTTEIPGAGTGTIGICGGGFSVAPPCVIVKR